jgi:hypothetical protein
MHLLGVKQRGGVSFKLLNSTLAQYEMLGHPIPIYPEPAHTGPM